MAKKYVIKKGDKFWPSDEMKKIAWVKDEKIYSDASKNPIKFWEKLAKEGISWESTWKKTYIEKLPYFEWFKGGKLNFSANCLDRWIRDKGDKIALIFVPEPVKIHINGSPNLKAKIPLHPSKNFALENNENKNNKSEIFSENL